MGLSSLTPESEEQSSGAGKTTYVTFKNPRTADISEGSEHRHKQEYYDSVQELRNMLGQDINVPIGEFAAAAVAAENGDPEPLEDLFERLAE